MVFSLIRAEENGLKMGGGAGTSRGLLHRKETIFIAQFVIFDDF